MPLRRPEEDPALFVYVVLLEELLPRLLLTVEIFQEDQIGESFIFDPFLAVPSR